MKKMITLLVLILSTYTFAANQAEVQTQLNLVSKYESEARKYKSELYLRNKQVKNSTKQLVSINNEYSKLSSSYRQLAGEAQYLKFQNEQLINELKKLNSFTPELAKKMDSLKGRLPASLRTKK
jgi:chromosome segregation ATPase